METLQIYNRREAEQQREKWCWKDQLKHGPAVERQQKGKGRKLESFPKDYWKSTATKTIKKTIEN